MKLFLIVFFLALVGLGGYGMNDGGTSHQDSDDGGSYTEMDPVENEAFQIAAPLPNQLVDGEFTLKGKARVFEANFQYELKDGDIVLEKDFITASEGAPGWGEFERVIPVPETVKDQLTLKVFVSSAKDGSEVNVLEIPLNVE